MTNRTQTTRKKPIKVFYSELSGRFYASRHYRQEGNLTVITGEKFDVTSDIGYFVNKYNLEFARTETRH